MLKLGSSTNTFGGYARLKSLAKDLGEFTGSPDRLALLATAIACALFNKSRDMNLPS